MSTTEKIVMYVDGQAKPDPTECFAIRGKTMIDVINPLTGKTAIYGKTLQECQRKVGYEHAEHMTIEEYCRSKAEAQDEPVSWIDITEDRYYEMLECLPPALYTSLGFLIGEPWDHHALTGQPRYGAFIVKGGKYFSSSRPMTKAEFRNLLSMEIQFLNIRGKE